MHISSSFVPHALGCELTGFHASNVHARTTGPIQLLAGLSRSESLLLYHFFSVALYGVKHTVRALDVKLQGQRREEMLERVCTRYPNSSRRDVIDNGEIREYICVCSLLQIFPPPPAASGPFSAPPLPFCQRLSAAVRLTRQAVAIISPLVEAERSSWTFMLLCRTLRLLLCVPGPTVDPELVNYIN